ncbi:MAG TPA: DUF393 domain-containing protein [Gammaproteobacteria bacterium]|nr:DUF393 domain-containing protein [Gammaproteobacteria bacterium]
MSEPIVLFDGVCNFCSDAVKFVIDRNTAKNVRFCQLQTATGKALLAEHGRVDPGLTSMALIADGRLYVKSSAALRVCRYLRAPWPLMGVFLLVPTPLRNLVYDWFGRNRYRWFGKKAVCWIPEADIRQRFLE